MNNYSKLFNTFQSYWEKCFSTRTKSEINNGEDIIPWAPLSKPISSARFAVISTAGAHMLSQEPFNRDEKGDPSYREIFSVNLTAVNHVVDSCGRKKKLVSI